MIEREVPDPWLQERSPGVGFSSRSDAVWESSSFDLAVIGLGPAGRRAAIEAAKLGRSVAAIGPAAVPGVGSTHSATLVSKAMREVVLQLTGLAQRGADGHGYLLRDQLDPNDLRERLRLVARHEQRIVRDQLFRHHVDVMTGVASFLDPYTILVRDPVGEERPVRAKRFVIATGSRPASAPGVELNAATIFDPDTILSAPAWPDSLVVVGGNVVGIEYASMFAALGTRVTIIDAETEVLRFCDRELVESLLYHLRDLNVVFRLGEPAVRVHDLGAGTVTQLTNGTRIAADAVLYSAGRVAATSDLNLGALGLETDGDGRIPVDDRFRTVVPHVHAVGDVTAFPSLASTSAEQGRIASCDAFDIEEYTVRDLLPLAVYSIPEIGFVGSTEWELSEAGVPYEVGIAHYRELARGQIDGERNGMLKLLVSPNDRSILGVHALGTRASEAVHLGQAVMALGGTVDMLVDTIFNYPTFAQAYNVAAFDAYDKLRALSALTPG